MKETNDENMKSPRPRLSLSLSGSSELSDLIAKARSEFSQTFREVRNTLPVEHDIKIRTTSMT